MNQGELQSYVGHHDHDIANALKAKALHHKQEARKAREIISELLARFPAPECAEQQMAVEDARRFLLETDPNQLSFL